MIQETRSLNQRLLAFFMAFAMVFGMLPTVSLAADPAPTISVKNGSDAVTNSVTLGYSVDTVTLDAFISSSTNHSDTSWLWSGTSNGDLVTITDSTKESATIKLNSPLDDGAEKTVTLKITYDYSTPNSDSTATEEQTAVETTVSVTFRGKEVVAPESTPDPDPIPESLTLTVSPTSISVGDTAKATVTVTYDDNSTEVVTSSATYTFGTSGIVTNSSGTFTGSKEGSTTITASYTEDGKTVTSSEVTLTVKAAEVAVPVLSVTASEISFEYGSTGKINATVKNSVSGQSITYTSNDTDVVTVDSSGNLVAVSAGTATVTVSYTGAESITVTVTVTDSSITDTSTVASMYISHNGSTASNNFTTISTTNTKNAQLTVKLLDAAGNNITASSVLSSVQWSVSNGSNVVSMTSTGVSYEGERIFTAVGAGLATVTATYGSLSCEFKITVSGITVDATPVSGGMLTHSTSDVITVSTFGEASGVQWTARNSGLVTIEFLNDEKTEAILKTNDSTGTGVIDITSTDGSTSFSLTVNEAIASHIIPVYNINNVNVLRFSSLVKDFNDRTAEIYPGETLLNLQSLEVSPTQGTLYISYQNEDNPGAGVASSGSYSFTGYPSALDIVFVPNGSYTGDTAIIKYTGKTDQDHTFYGEIHATLASIDDVYNSTGSSEPLELNSYSFMQIASNSGKSIDYVVFSIPDENRGVMYYDYKSLDNFHHIMEPGEQMSKSDLDKITVIPTGGYTGSLVIPYIIYATDGSTIIGELTIYIEGYGPEGPVVYNTIAGEYITLITDDFQTNVQAVTGSAMNYITFQIPSASEGTLYELYYSDSNYRKLVTEGTPYYASARSPQISEVSFVPAPGFSGTCNINFIGFDLEGNSYQGTIEVNVGTQSIGDINYICSANSYVPFYEGDFNQFSRDMTGYNVDYISFPNVPSSTQGALRLGQTTYHDGVSVTADTKYYVDDSPLMSKLSFNATTGYTGIVSIPFEGASAGGIEFAGVLTIVVTNQNLVTIPYNATFYSPAEFDSIDFEHYAQERTGSSLDYVRFELPLETNGILYYNFVTGDDYGSLVDVSTNYYVNQSHFLNGVSFVPNRDFQGTVQINFTAWGENGQSFSGIISVYVADGGDPLSYYMYSGESLYLNAAAFQDFCYSETGSNLNYITIASPSSSQGYLYQDYDPSSSSQTTVSSTTKLYRSQSPYISNLAFVSNESYMGTVNLNFTATATDGSTCTGTVYILVRPSEASSAVYYYTSFSPIQLNEADIYEVWSSEDIDYIEIHNIPTTTQGKLYYENNLSSFATTDLKYYGSGSETGPYISQMVYAPRAGFSGTMIVSYTATTVSGRSFSGDICVVVTTGQPSLYFDDMSNHLWATASADYLYITQVSTGTSNRVFAPSNNITRGDFALMLQKAFRFTGTETQDFSDVATDAYYYSAVQTLRSLGVTSGYSNNTFKPNDFISRQDAMIMLNTAMALANKGVPSASISALNQFTDSGSVASYAQAAMSAMVSGGLLSGSGGKLNPEQNMTRAEMAVVLHQAMTY